jgi:hypothetical protein
MMSEGVFGGDVAAERLPDARCAMMSTRCKSTHSAAASGVRRRRNARFSGENIASGGEIKPQPTTSLN